MGCGTSAPAASETGVVASAPPLVASAHPTSAQRGKLSPVPSIKDDWGDADELGRNNHDTVAAINAALKDRGLNTWFDSDQLKGNVLNQMTRGIDSSVAVAVFITKRYLEKAGGDNPADNCLIEFGYGQRRKPACLISVPVEPRMRNPASWTGAVGAALGSDLYSAHFSDRPTSGTLFELNVDLLYTRIIAIVKEQIQLNPALAGTGAPKAAPAGAATPTAAASSGPSPAEFAISLRFLFEFASKHLSGPGDAATTTKELVMRHIMPTIEAKRCRYTELLDRQDVWATAEGSSAAEKRMCFISHAFGNPFALVVESLKKEFEGADPLRTFVWIDIFAINQHDPSSDLDGGKMLTETIDLSERTLVILDQSALALSRLWCLYEIAVTPRGRLAPLTFGFTLRQIAAVIKQIDVASAGCFSELDELVIHALICEKFTSLAQLTDYLRGLMGVLLADALGAEGIEAGGATTSKDQRGSSSGVAAPSPAPAGGTGEDFDSEIAAMEKELKRKRAEMEKKAAKEKKMAELEAEAAALERREAEQAEEEARRREQLAQDRAETEVVKGRAAVAQAAAEAARQQAALVVAKAVAEKAEAEAKGQALRAAHQAELDALKHREAAAAASQARADAEAAERVARERSATAEQQAAADAARLRAATAVAAADKAEAEIAEAEARAKADAARQQAAVEVAKRKAAEAAAAADKAEAEKAQEVAKAEAAAQAAAAERANAAAPKAVASPARPHVKGEVGAVYTVGCWTIACDKSSIAVWTAEGFVWGTEWSSNGYAKIQDGTVEKTSYGSTRLGAIAVAPARKGNSVWDKIVEPAVTGGAPREPVLGAADDTWDCGQVTLTRTAQGTVRATFSNKDAATFFEFAVGGPGLKHFINGELYSEYSLQAATVERAKADRQHVKGEVGAVYTVGCWTIARDTRSIAVWTAEGFVWATPWSSNGFARIQDGTVEKTSYGSTRLGAIAVAPARKGNSVWDKIVEPAVTGGAPREPVLGAADDTWDCGQVTLTRTAQGTVRATFSNAVAATFFEFAVGGPGLKHFKDGELYSEYSLQAAAAERAKAESQHVKGEVGAVYTVGCWTIARDTSSIAVWTAEGFVWGTEWSSNGYAKIQDGTVEKIQYIGTRSGAIAVAPARKGNSVWDKIVEPAVTGGAPREPVLGAADDTWDCGDVTLTRTAEGTVRATFSNKNAATFYEFAVGGPGLKYFKDGELYSEYSLQARGRPPSIASSSRHAHMLPAQAAWM